MGLRINTNVESLIAQRHLTKNQGLLNRTLERLSSSLRINRAADDPSGLVISEGMRTQVRGFERAVANAQDSLNLVAVAEGAMDVATSILQRMRELAIQGANDSLTNSDRAKIQVEIDQLREELTRVSTTTEYNTRKLLDGTLTAATLGENASLNIEQNVRIGDNSATIPILQDFISNTSVLTSASIDIAFQVKFVAFQASGTAPVSIAMEVRSSNEEFLYSVDVNGVGGVPPTQLSLSFGGVIVGTLDVNAASVSLDDVGKSAIIQLTPRKAAQTVDNSLNFQIGAAEGQFVRIGFDSISGEALGLEGMTVRGNDDEDSRLSAQNAIGTLDRALDQIATLRARLGAYQSRIENTITNALSLSRINLAESEARIRDADYSVEATNLVRAQILVQAGTAILGQANVNTQAALSLI